MRQAATAIGGIPTPSEETRWTTVDEARSNLILDVAASTTGDQTHDELSIHPGFGRSVEGGLTVALHPIMLQALAPFIAPADLTIAQELEARGYGHRASKMEGRREVFHVKTGEIVGDFWAHKAIEAVEAHAALQSQAPPSPVEQKEG